MKKQKQENYDAKLQESYERWEYLYKHGGCDPFWSDGVNLNLVRNHIFYYRNKLEENPTLFGFPAAYYKEIPPKVDQDYMARPDEIRANAKATLEKYKVDPNYLYILKHYNDFTPKTRNRLSLDNVIGYVWGLERYIKEDKLVDMRRHESPERCLDSFEDCVNRMKATPSEQVQVFSLNAGLLDEAEEYGDNDFGEDADDDYENDNELVM